jgi:hypothetical protein
VAAKFFETLLSWIFLIFSLTQTGWVKRFSKKSWFKDTKVEKLKL